MNGFLDMVKDIEKVRRRAELDCKRTGHLLGTYEDGYLSALNFTITRINMYLEQVKKEIEEEKRNDITRD